MKLPNLPRKSVNDLPLSKKVRIGKGTEKNNEDDVVSLRGDLAKALEAMGIAKKTMAQVTHTASRIPRRIFIQEKVGKIK